MGDREVEKTLVSRLKQPCLVPLLFYGAGILLGCALEPPLAWLLALAIGLALAAAALEQWRPTLLAACLMLLGWANLLTRTETISPHDLRTIIDERDHFVTLRGHLVDTPTLRVIMHDAEPAYRTHAVLKVVALAENANWRPAYGRVAITTRADLGTNFFGGQEVEVTGVLRKPPVAVAEGLFDYGAYLRWQGIHRLLNVALVADWKLTAAGAAAKRPWADRFVRWGQATLARGLSAEDENVKLLWAMTLGWKTGLTDEVAGPFMKSGTMHVFAISGLHIALIAHILAEALVLVRVPRQHCGWLVIPFIWFYTAATGWQPSAIRSTIMMSIVIIGWMLRRPGNLLNSLAASALIILAWQPQQLFQAGFQLSFVVVLSIALASPWAEKCRTYLEKDDPLLPESLVPRHRRWSRWALARAAQAFLVTSAASLGSLPLIAIYFHLVTPCGLLANLFVVALSSVALAANLAGLFFGLFAGPIAEIFNHAAWFCMELMVKISAWSTLIPGGFFYVAAPSIFECLFAYALFWGLLAGFLGKAPRRRWAVLLALCLVGSAGLRWYWQQSEVHITFLRGGDATLVDQPGRKNDAVIDASSASGLEFVLRPFLQSQGINRLPHLLLTHGDTRHVGGALKLDQEFRIREIATGHAGSRSPAYRAVQEYLARNPQRWRQLRRGDVWNGFQVLHPAAEDSFPQADDNAVVLRGELEGVRILLLSELGRAGQRALLGRETDLRADVVVAGAPEQGESLSEELLEAIRPELIILQEDTQPSHARARRQLRERLAQQHVPVISTTEDGTATLTLRHAKWRVTTMESTAFAGGKD